MTKDEALRKIKQLRDDINDHSDPASTGWVNDVLYLLDEASDRLEFIQEPGEAK